MYGGGCSILHLIVMQKVWMQCCYGFFQESKGGRVLELGDHHYSLNPETLFFKRHFEVPEILKGI